MSSLPAPVPSDPRQVVKTASPRRPPLVVARLQPGQRPPVSAIVTTHNAAATLDACLRSLGWCDEVLVVDSHSSDDTVAVARRHDRVRVLQRRYYGAASQKNWAIDRVRHDWVLILDADERVTPELEAEIGDRLAAPDPPTSFAIPRRTFSLGREVRFSGWQHDRVVRLFRRDAARYPNRRVHADMMTLDPPVPLDAALEHRMVDDLSEYAGRLQRYAVWGAAQLWRDGRRAGAWEIAVRPAWRFVRTYLLQGGVLEGMHGLMMCAMPAYAAFLKYATLWSWGVGEARGRLPELPEFDEDPATWSWPASTVRREGAEGPVAARGL